MNILMDFFQNLANNIKEAHGIPDERENRISPNQFVNFFKKNENGISAPQVSLSEDTKSLIVNYTPDLEQGCYVLSGTENSTSIDLLALSNNSLVSEYIEYGKKVFGVEGNSQAEVPSIIHFDSCKVTFTLENTKGSIKRTVYINYMEPSNDIPQTAILEAKKGEKVSVELEIIKKVPVGISSLMSSKEITLDNCIQLPGLREEHTYLLFQGDSNIGIKPI